MSVATFIPQIWSARLLNALQGEMVYANLFNRNYEGLIQQYGDTVHINTISDVSIKDYTKNSEIAAPDALETVDAALKIDKGDYFNFYVDDVDKFQSMPGLIEAAMQSASTKLVEKVDKYLAGLLAAGTITAGLGNDTTPTAVTAENAYGLLVKIKTALDKANVARAGRKIVLPPEFEGFMLQDNRFAYGAGTKAEERLENGVIARAAGFDIYISNNVPNTSNAKYKVVATTTEAATFAEQILHTEAYRPEKRFADAVKGLHVYGAKVVRPAAVAVATVNFG